MSVTTAAVSAKIRILRRNKPIPPSTCLRRIFDLYQPFGKTVRKHTLRLRDHSVRSSYALVASCSALFLAIALRAVSILYSDPKPIDFLSSWAAARLALRGQAAAAYDLNAHHAAEQLAVTFHSLLPFA